MPRSQHGADRRGTISRTGYAPDRLLAMSDNELWDLIAGREPPADPAIAPLVAQLRAA